MIWSEHYMMRMNSMCGLQAVSALKWFVSRKKPALSKNISVTHQRNQTTCINHATIISVQQGNDTSYFCCYN